MKSNTRKFTLSLLSASILAAPLAFADSNNITEGVTKALSDSKVNLSFRARYEDVQQDAADGGDQLNASALTVRSRLTVNTGAYKNFSFGVEVDNVTALIDDYNDLTLDYSGDNAVVADPEITDINQVFIKYKNDDVSVTAGRQRINLDDQRFVGGVGWRQNEQTYDGVRVQYQINDQIGLDYSYIQNVNRIFAENSKKADDLAGDFNLVNLAYNINADHKITAFAYILDFNKAASMSTSTYGALYNGNLGAVALKARYATQSDNGDNPTNFSVDYINFEVAVKLDSVKLIAGYELLGSDNGVGFSTPFATLHKFNGFADKFLGTPGAGLQDAYITAKTKVSGVALSATYHNLFSDADSIDYGTEIDLAAAYKINKNYSALIKLASYDSDEYATDTSKLWIMLTAKF